MRPLRAVLFDVGDTLFERRLGARVIVEVARELGAEVAEDAAARLWQEVHARSRTPEELAKGRDLSPEAHRAAWTELYRAADAIAEGMAEALYEREIDPAFWAPFPDTRPTLEALRERGVPVGVVSDAGFDISRLFHHHGLAHLVGTFVISYQHGATKPSAKLFEVACERLGVAPAETLMVGDIPWTDGGAVSAGLTCLLLPLTPPGAPRGLGRVLQLVDGGRPR